MSNGKITSTEIKCDPHRLTIITERSDWSRVFEKMAEGLFLVSEQTRKQGDYKEANYQTKLAKQLIREIEAARVVDVPDNLLRGE